MCARAKGSQPVSRPDAGGGCGLRDGVVVPPDRIMRGLGSRVARQQRSEHQPIRLRCLGGDVAPDDIVADASRLGKLSEGAIAGLWSVLQPCVTQSMSEELGRHLSTYCLKHEVAAADLGHVIRICRWLLHQAASVDLSLEHLGADIDRVWPEPGELRDVLLENYPTVKNQLRDMLQTGSRRHPGLVSSRCTSPSCRSRKPPSQ